VQAVTSVLLLGLLPFWAAVALAKVLDLPAPASPLVAIAGLALPFVAGLAGLADLRRTLRFLADRLPATHARLLQRLGSRGRCLSRVVLWRFSRRSSSGGEDLSEVSSGSPRARKPTKIMFRRAAGEWSCLRG
jgi:hypothetical protein